MIMSEQPKRKGLAVISAWFEDEIIPFMGSKMMIFLLTLLLLVPMVKHTKEMYMANVSHNKEYIGLIYAIILDGATLIAVLRARGSKYGIAWWSIGYAFVGLLVNIFYLFDTPKTYPKITIAVMIPLTIAYFSHELAQYKKRKKSNGK